MARFSWMGNVQVTEIELLRSRSTRLQSGVSGSTTNRQNLAYQWDTVGKLTQRQDVSQNLTEIFTYDTLDRVTGSTRNGVSNLTVGYDAAGRITTKTGAGSYTYGDSAHPHAATAAGTQTRTYDANGNVATLNGQMQTWTSFNLPSILKSSASVQPLLPTCVRHRPLRNHCRRGGEDTMDDTHGGWL